MRFSQEFAKKPTDWQVDAMQDDVEFTDLPASYHSHPVTTARGHNSSPVSLYSDGIPLHNRETFIVWYFTSLLSRKRYLVCSLKKGDDCKCGCRGMCTFIAIHTLLVWMFNVLASGVWCTTDHLGNPLTGWRHGKVGELANGWAGALCEYRADLLEMVTAYGFKTWANIL